MTAKTQREVSPGAAPQTEEGPTMHLLRQREGALFELNERIARLAMLLEAPLRTEEDLQRVLTRELPVFGSTSRQGADGFVMLARLNREDR